jgi:hypothetical protein
VRLEHYDHPFGADLASPGHPVEWRSKAPLLGGGEDDFFAALQAKKYRSSLLTGRSRVASFEVVGSRFACFPLRLALEATIKDRIRLTGARQGKGLEWGAHQGVLAMLAGGSW